MLRRLWKELSGNGSSEGSTSGLRRLVLDEFEGKRIAEEHAGQRRETEKHRVAGEAKREEERRAKEEFRKSVQTHVVPVLQQFNEVYLKSRGTVSLGENTYRETREVVEVHLKWERDIKAFIKKGEEMQANAKAKPETYSDRIRHESGGLLFPKLPLPLFPKFDVNKIDPNVGPTVFVQLHDFHCRYNTGRYSSQDYETLQGGGLIYYDFGDIRSKDFAPNFIRKFAPILTEILKTDPLPNLGSKNGK